jgi:hypothetical protein
VMAQDCPNDDITCIHCTGGERIGNHFFTQALISAAAARCGGGGGGVLGGNAVAAASAFEAAIDAGDDTDDGNGDTSDPDRLNLARNVDSVYWLALYLPTY